jgi:predicted amidohydrolase
MKTSNNKFKVGLVQMTSNHVIADNTAMAETLIREAAAKGADFILTPEVTTLFDFGTKQIMEKIVPEELKPKKIKINSKQERRTTEQLLQEGKS